MAKLDDNKFRNLFCKMQIYKSIVKAHNGEK